MFDDVLRVIQPRWMCASLETTPVRLDKNRITRCGSNDPPCDVATLPSRELLVHRQKPPRRMHAILSLLP